MSFRFPIPGRPFGPGGNLGRPTWLKTLSNFKKITAIATVRPKARKETAIMSLQRRAIEIGRLTRRVSASFKVVFGKLIIFEMADP